jgi:hypothetical protein
MKMNSKQKIKAFKKAYQNYYENWSEGLNMSLAMDGSGECGKFIGEGFEDSMFNFIHRLLNKLNLSIEEIKKNILSWDEIERQFVKPHPAYCEQPTSWFQLILCEYLNCL